MWEDRIEAGQKLADALAAYADRDDVVIFGLPRGGVVVAAEVARAIGAPLDIITARKIGHPQNPEYAIAAVTETGEPVVNEVELFQADEAWFNEALDKARAEAKRRYEMYIDGRYPVSATGKTAVIIDDGVATGLTIRAAIKEIKLEKPKQIIIGIPVAPTDTLLRLATIVDKIVCLHPDPFLMAVGHYYERFDQTEDREVVQILEAFAETA